jgi:hypothetical protein
MANLTPMSWLSFRDGVTDEYVFVNPGQITHIVVGGAKATDVVDGALLAEPGPGDISITFCLADGKQRGTHGEEAVRVIRHLARHPIPGLQLGQRSVE